jgi:hypothetical protein
MAIIPANEKVFMVGTSTNTTYGGSAALKAMQQWYTMQDVIDTVGGPASVLTTYPVTNAALAGERFWYKGNEWHYMTQAEIDSAGWTGLVSVGFPAPVYKNLNKYIYFSDVEFVGDYNSLLSVQEGTTSTIVDFIGLGLPNKIRRIIPDSSGNSLLPYGITITGFKNANLLSELENLGTTNALRFINNGLTALVIDDLFTQLPSTTKTVTINVNGNPGAATCNPTIATAKGYTVVV